MLNELFIAHGWKWGSAAWLTLYLIVVFALVYYRKRLPREAGAFGAAMLLYIVIMYNPAVAWVALRFIPSGHEYTRIGWGMLVVPVIAYGCVRMYELLSERLRAEEEVISLPESDSGDRSERRRRFLYRAAPWLLAAVIVFLAANKTQGYFVLPENIYKIPDEAIQAAELMEEYAADVPGAAGSDDTEIPGAGDKGTGYAGEESRPTVGVMFPVGLGQGTTAQEKVYFGLRHYEGSYIFSVVGDMPQEPLYDYLLADIDDDAADYGKLGYSEIGRTASCVVYAR